MAGLLRGVQVPDQTAARPDAAGSRSIPAVPRQVDQSPRHSRGRRGGPPYHFAGGESREPRSFREREIVVLLRLWSVHPSYLDARGLVALWREALLAQAVLRGRTKG